MSTFSMLIGGEIIILRKVSDKTQLKSTVDRFMNTLESSLAC